MPTPRRFLKFLRSQGLRLNAITVVFELMQLTDKDGGTTCFIKDKTLAEATGIRLKTLPEVVNEERFRALVSVVRGKHEGNATTYDLAPLFERLGEWRRPGAAINVVEAEAVEPQAVPVSPEPEEDEDAVFTTAELAADFCENCRPMANAGGGVCPKCPAFRAYKAA